ncbi:transglutaminase family protein [Sagittula sp. NFXS13]|uniref:transglutaminase family protein n=1 Tax=Sagittula sp. NFXS13 TaxID=2819095 RepID=UPI0032DFA531
MQYDITLEIGYRFEHPATAARTLLRMFPINTSRQTLLHGSLTCSPQASERRDEVDFFGNMLTSLMFSAPLKDVRFRFEGRVQRIPFDGGLDLSPPLAVLPREIDGVASLGPHSPHHYLGPSERIQPVGEIAAFGQDVTAAALTTLEAVLAVSRGLHALFDFDATATDVATDPAEAFAQRRGVCQDISHVMIGALRAVGIPAGYVSGFLRTQPPPGQPRLSGADAMHAWVRAWCGRELGWVEIDPTNDLRVALDHVVVAYGRDYADVSPVKGSLRSAGPHKTQHSVDMVPEVLSTAG